MRIILIGGGWSPEREVSLKGCEIIKSILEELGHEVIFIDPLHQLEDLYREAKRSDFALLNLHGQPGEDGVIQAILDNAGCPYQGSDTKGSLLALNKAVAKLIFKEHNIPTPKWEFVPSFPDRGWKTNLKFPVFVKPNRGGSSIDIKMVSNHKDLYEAVYFMLNKGEEVLLEEKIEGLEVTCGILDNVPLPLVLIKPKSYFFDYNSKYSDNGADEICPAPLSEGLTKKIKRIALQCHKILGLMDYSRVDFIVKKDTPYVLEVNTLPGMTERSLLPLSANQMGYDYKKLIEKLIELGLRKRTESKREKDG